MDPLDDIAGQVTLPELKNDEGYPFQYWRKADGDIVVAPSWPTEAERFRDNGWVPLKQYGKFLLTQPLLNAQGEVIGTWHVNFEPYRQIFRKGGAHEFTVEQVLEHGWHRKPPYRGVVFPQLAGITQEDVVCSQCKKPFLNAHDLGRHESIIHATTAQNTAMARELAKANADNGTNQAMVGVLRMLVEKMEVSEKRQSEQAELIARLLGGKAK